MSKTFLNVSFKQKDRVKVLGARWDPDVGQWYVPAGVALTAFGEWLPASNLTQQAVAVTSSNDLSTSDSLDRKAMSLSQLLTGVAQAVANAFRQGVWTRAEVLNVSVKSGHIYLELSERDPEGRVLAKALGTIWARTADQILPAFEQATGAQLAPGIKLMVLAKPTFKAQFGLSLDITEIDPSYTLGNLEAQKRAIRERLKSEGVLDANKQLAPPWDYRRVLVIAPENAAGLGDFASEANRLHQHQVCEFIYQHSLFQGDGAAAAILRILREGVSVHGAELDAVIIIRGGGAVNDLAWLNDYALARFVCDCKIPVLTGIGHERDSTVLDEVAHRKFDTPSKVIAGIESHIVQRAKAAADAYEQVTSIAARSAQRTRLQCERLNSDIRTAALGTVSQGRRRSESHIAQIQLDALSQLHEAASASQALINELKDIARDQLLEAKLEVPAAMTTVRELSVAALRNSRASVAALLPAVLDQVQSQAHRGRQDIVTAHQTVINGVQQAAKSASVNAKGLMLEIAGQGPEKTLARGFAMVKDSKGNTITSAASATSAGASENIALYFHDGAIEAKVQTETNSEGKSNG